MGNIEGLIKHLKLDSAAISQLYADDFTFPLKVPEEFIARMRKGDPNDPLLLQILPTKLEKQTARGYTKDPLMENECSPLPGLVHKYYGRVLVILTDECPINCRFCFRRYLNLPGTDNAADWRAILQYIQNNTTISEVILSGGDPLILSCDRLGKVIDDLAAIAHVARVRVHSRVPIVKPRLVSDRMLTALTRQKRLQIVLVAHCNHPNEIDKSVAKMSKKCQEFGINLFNQTVLLQGINDNDEVLTVLCEKLFAIGIIPYYLHLLDKVQGVRQFFVPKARARKIFRKLQGKLPGYLCPRLVQDGIGEQAKTIIT